MWHPIVEIMNEEKSLKEKLESIKGEIRAIYIGDVRFNNCPVFQLNKATNEFVMIEDEEFKYALEDVVEDNDFYIFEIYNDDGYETVRRIFL